jgi:cephalosporin-C deacetylase-like acetyl esterase
MVMLPPGRGDAMACALVYSDPVSFAPDVHCPVLMNCGMIDPISPPSSVFAVFNRLGSQRKEIVALDGLGHDSSGEFDRSAWRWLDSVRPRSQQTTNRKVAQ